MGWDEDTVINAAYRVDGEGTLWILFLAQNGEVGIEKTSNLEKLDSSVRAYAKELGLEDPGLRTVRDGFSKIENRSVTDADGVSDTINNDDKSNNLVRLTPLGQDLVTFVNKDDRIRNELKELIGVEVESVGQPWWPYDGPSTDLALRIRTFADRSVLEEAQTEITAVVSFDCPNCEATIENERFEVTMVDGDLIEWGRTDVVDCSLCGASFEICPIDPNREPEEVL